MPTTIESAGQLEGVFPAIFTPLKYDDPKCLNNTIDYDKAKIIIDDLIRAGAAGVVPVGTTGQSATLTPQQHIDFIRFTLDYVDGRVPIIAGAGSNCTRESVDTMSQLLKVAGPLAFLCVTGYYNNPPQEGIVKHFQTLSAETDSKIIMYNVPGRTNSYMTADTVITLSADKNIIGLKQAVDFKNPGQHRDDTIKISENVDKSNFTLLTGEDDALFAILEIGGKGMITATGNLPEAVVIYREVLEAYNTGDKAKAAERNQAVIPYVKACFVRKNPIPLAALFNSPLYQPLISVKDTAGGEEAQNGLMQFVAEKAPSLKKYHS